MVLNNTRTWEKSLILNHSYPLLTLLPHYLLELVASCVWRFIIMYFSRMISHALETNLYWEMGLLTTLVVRMISHRTCCNQEMSNSYCRIGNNPKYITLYNVRCHYSLNKVGDSSYIFVTNLSYQLLRISSFTFHREISLTQDIVTKIVVIRMKCWSN